MESPEENFLAICLTNRESPDQRLVFTTGGREVKNELFME